MEGSLDTLYTTTILSSGDFRQVVKGELFMPKVQVFLFHNTFGVMCGLLVFLSLFPLAFYIVMLVECSLCFGIFSK